MTICITTGFKNLGRENWDSFRRDTSEYFKGFNALTQNSPYPIVAYVDSEYIESINPSRVGLVRTVPIEEVDLLINSHNERDWEVMNSYEYRVLMNKCRHPVSHPERSKKGYNMINASKAGMIAHTKKLYPGFGWYAWQDFGNVNLEGGLPTVVDESKLCTDKIMVHGKYVNPRNEVMIDPVGLARTGGAPYLCGAQFIVPSALVEFLEAMIRGTVEYYHDINLTDDDQALMAVIMKERPEFFEWVGLGDEWYGLWKHYGVK